MNAVKRSVVCLLLVGLNALAGAQSVRNEYRISGSTTRTPNRLAEETAIDWPTLEPDTTGTQIHVTSDFRNSDITIYTFKSYGTGRLFNLGHRLADYLGVPKTDFVHVVGRRLAGIDLEFNRSIHFDGNRSESRVEVGRAVQFLLQEDLPKPIGVYVKVEEGDVVEFAGRRLSKSTLLTPKDVPADAVRISRSERHWYGLFIGIAFAIFFSAMPVWVLSLTVRSQKKPVPDLPETPGGPKSLAENQSKYQGLKALRSVWPLLLIPILGSPTLFKPALEDAFKWAPPGSDKWIMFFPLIMLVPFGVSVVVRRMRPKDVTTPRPPNLMPRMGLLFAPLLLMCGILLLLNVAPQLFWKVPPTLFRVVIFSIPAVTFIAYGYLTWRDSKRQITPLGPGDEDYDVTMQWAQKAGAKVTTVVIQQSDSANASAMFGGRVTITSAAREKLTREERAAVLAHEVGHVRRQHVAKLMLITLVVLFVLNFVVFRRLDAQRDQYPAWAKVVIDTLWLTPFPVILIVNALVAPMRKRAEYEADRFALEAVGDFSTLARALAKIHLVNGAPHTRVGLDEYLASHPSLTKRLALLQETAISLGMAVPPNVVQDLLESDPYNPIQSGAG